MRQVGYWAGWGWDGDISINPLKLQRTLNERIDKERRATSLLLMKFWVKIMGI